MNSIVRPILRGLQNLVANWPLLLIRFAEMIAVFVVTFVSGLIAVAVAGLGWLVTGWRDLENDPTRLAEWIVHHPLPLLVGLVVFFFGLGLGLVVHSFVLAGATGCWIAGERKGGDAPASFAAFEAFSMVRWIEEARRSFWPVFLIYNVTWGVFGLVLVLPIGALAVALLLVGASTAILPMTCAGAFVFLLLAFVGGVIAQLWTGISVALSTGGDRDVRAPLGDAFRVMAARPGPVIVLLVVMTAIGMAIGGMFAGLNFGLGFLRQSPNASLGLLPVELALSFIQGSISLVTSSWMVTGLVAIVEDWRPSSPVGRP